MAKVKVINRRNGSELIGANFKNVASETIFTFGTFTVDTNFGVRTVRNYKNILSSFVKPITLDTLNISQDDSTHIFNYTQSVLLNFDKSDLSTYARFGSLTEILRVSVENIILSFPASIFATYQQSSFIGLASVINYTYDPHIDVANFTIPVPAIVNRFGLVINEFNNQLPQDDPLRNLNVSYSEYLIWRVGQPDDKGFNVIGFTGYTSNYQFLTIKCNGNPFPELSGTTQGQFNYHLKPKPIHFNKFKSHLSTLEAYLLNDKISGRTGGYKTVFKTPIEVDDGTIAYSDKEVIWTASDGYNIDTNGYLFDVFWDALGTMGALYDQFKSDLIMRMLVPESIIENDLTDGQKMSKLLRVYGASFDMLKIFIDALVTINKLSYDKKNNVPDVLVKNLAKTLGWDGIALVQEDDLLESFFSTNYKKSNDLSPSEVDIELWRRILINTNYLYKSKGTRESIKTMLLMVGIPDPFINITEYVYTVDSVINPNNVTINLADLPSSTLPYNTSGYPVAPKETKTFYFQISGSSDSGQAYMDNFRKVGFTLNRTPDNKKSWVQSGATNRIHHTTPTYYQEDSKLILNTKEVDVTLDIARGIEYDVYKYNIENNFPITSSGVTKPYLYINIPFTYGNSANVFSIPEIPQGDIQVSFNGVTMVKGNSPSDLQADYYINPFNSKEAILINGAAQTYTNGYKDFITLTYVKDQSTGSTYSQIDYVVTKINSAPDGMTIPIIDTPLGEVQLVVNGITMTKSGSLFTGDYIINPSNPQEIIIVNNDLKNYLITNPIVVISYIKSNVSELILKKSEVYRIDSFSATKFFFNGIKYVYVLDYEPPDVKAVKIIVNGITLQNGTDFTLNGANRKQVLFTSNLNLGYIINAFYVTSTSVDTPFNFGNKNITNISQLSFLQYLDLINSRLINVKNRKTLSDHEGGIYPTVQKLYEEYLKRAFAQSPIVPSHGYTFSNVYPFINKFNSFFHRFIDVMLSATIILKKGGVLIRNTAFTKQKFTYRRGVSFNSQLQYLGDDGSEFRILQPNTQYSFSWSGETCVVITAATTTTTTTLMPTGTTTTTTTTTLPSIQVLFGNVTYFTNTSNSKDAYVPIIFNIPYTGAYTINLSRYTQLAHGILGLSSFNASINSPTSAPISSQSVSSIGTLNTNSGNLSVGAGQTLFVRLKAIAPNAVDLNATYANTQADIIAINVPNYNASIGLNSEFALYSNNAGIQPSGGGGSGPCLLGDEMILVDINGVKSPKQISDVVVGDYVYTKHSKFNVRGWYRVLNTYSFSTNKWLLFETEAGRKVRCSSTHLFMINDSATQAEKLTIENSFMIIGENGVITYDKIKKINVMNETVKVYNIEVENAHTYIGNNGIYHHNKLIQFQ